ncbi:hypothetical protein BC629DRAFT_1569023, partial [Irpex lacteus]
SGQLNELRLQVERLDYDNKESIITIDILKEQNQDAKNELEELKKTIGELKSTQKDASAEDKEKRKQEKMAMMMAKFDAQGTFSEKDEQLRQLLAKLDAIEDASSISSLSVDDVVAVQSGENEMHTRRRDELEGRIASLESEYEELLEKTIHTEDVNNVDIMESMAELKNKLEMQYAAKRDAHASEIQDLKQQLDIRSNEVRTLNATIDSLKSVNEELKRAFAVTSAGIEGGKNLAESAQDLERTRKAISVQLAEFDGVKKSLMRDLQNRCEKVVELEIQLDEIKEQYNNVIRNSNSKAQQKKMAFWSATSSSSPWYRSRYVKETYSLSDNRSRMATRHVTAVDQNSALKKEAGIAERKLLARNERIQNLETLLQDADRRLAVQNQKFEAQLQQVKDDWIRLEVRHMAIDYHRMLNNSLAQKAASSPLSFGRIAKPLRGGGGAAPANPASSTSPTLGASSANPLTRLQNDER